MVVVNGVVVALMKNHFLVSLHIKELNNRPTLNVALDDNQLLNIYDTYIHKINKHTCKEHTKNDDRCSSISYFFILGAT